MKRKVNEKNTTILRSLLLITGALVALIVLLLISRYLKEDGDHSTYDMIMNINGNENIPEDITNFPVSVSEFVGKNALQAGVTGSGKCVVRNVKLVPGSLTNIEPKND
jgi:hypothetical protein